MRIGGIVLVMRAGTDRRAVIRSIARLALVPAGALGVHQLRFWLAFGPGANVELERQGHAYLHSLVPWIVLLLAVAVGAFLWALGRALAGQRSVPRYTLSLVALWLASTGCLIAIYVGQEFLEGLFATGHPAGIAGVFGYGGWWSIPAALCVGLVLAVVVHGARWVLDEVAARRVCGEPRPVRHRLARPRIRRIDPLRPCPLAACAAGRAPPALR